MLIDGVWLTKLLLSHLITDFVLQPRSWIEERKRKHFVSPKLYLHGLITGGVAWLFLGWAYGAIALIVFVTHTIIDGWKSYRKDTAWYFLVDQALHLAVIFACWYYLFIDWPTAKATWLRLSHNTHIWVMVTAFTFVSFPASIIIGKLTTPWGDKIDDEQKSLTNAGKWIGIAERVIVLILVLHNEYSAIGLLVAAKGIIRFGEKDRQEAKTEYLVIGTLLSIGLAMATGLLAKAVQ
jgi:hypothetical protein